MNNQDSTKDKQSKLFARNLVLKHTTYTPDELDHMKDYELFYTAKTLIDCLTDIDNNSSVPSRFYPVIIVLGSLFILFGYIFFVAVGLV